MPNLSSDDDDAVAALECALDDAVNEAFEAQTPRPLEFIGLHLLRQAERHRDAEKQPLTDISDDASRSTSA